MATTRALTKAEHLLRHIELHHALDELMADYLAHNRKSRPSSTSLAELLHWSHLQTIEPVELDDGAPSQANT